MAENFEILTYIEHLLQRECFVFPHDNVSYRARKYGAQFAHIPIVIRTWAFTHPALAKLVGTDGQVWSNFWPAAGSTQWNGWFPIGPITFPQGFPVSVIHPRTVEGASAFISLAPI